MLRISLASCVLALLWTVLSVARAEEPSAKTPEAAETTPLKAEPLETAPPATVLLVTSKELAPAWKAFADWKTRLGKRTEVVTVETVKAKYQGEDVQAKIRACVLEHIAKRGTRWVVLGGDSLPNGEGHVPDRDTPHPTYGVADIPTDLYYISTEDWDANDDGTFGEWTKDRAAIRYTHPDACIARIPLRTRQDVSAYTNKVVEYETKYPTGTFQSRMLYTCPEPHAEPKLMRSWKDHIGPAWADGEMLSWFAGKSPWDGKTAGDFDLTPKNWQTKLGERTAGKIHMHGHGLLPVWLLEKHTKVDAKTVKSLKNAGAYPIITTVSCFTGHYDALEDPSIVESMLRQPQAGAVAVIAPSRPGVPVFAKRSDFRLMMTEGKLDGTTLTMSRFWANALGQDLTTGEAFAMAKKQMTKAAQGHAGYHWCQCELNLLGDPTLDVRARAPRMPKVEHVATAATGKTTITVTSDAPGATVCLWKRDEVYTVVVLDSNGNASIPVQTTSGGELLVTVSGPSLNAALSKITVD